MRRILFSMERLKGGRRKSEHLVRQAYVPATVASSRPSIQMPGLARKNAASASTRVINENYAASVRPREASHAAITGAGHATRPGLRCTGAGRSPRRTARQMVVSESPVICMRALRLMYGTTPVIVRSRLAAWSGAISVVVMHSLKHQVVSFFSAGAEAIDCQGTKILDRGFGFRFPPRDTRCCVVHGGDAARWVDQIPIAVTETAGRLPCEQANESCVGRVVGPEVSSRSASKC
jgi:hypothetical protein